MKPDTRSYYVLAVQRVTEHAASHLDSALALDPLAAQAPAALSLPSHEAFTRACRVCFGLAHPL